MKRPQEITTKLRKCDPTIKLYVGEMEKVNLKLHKQIAKLQAQNVDYQNEIKALKNEAPEYKIFVRHNYDDVKDLTDNELENRIKELEKERKSRKKTPKKDSN